MNELGQIYSAEQVDPGASAADHTMDGAKVPEGKILRIDIMSITDLTNAAKKVRLGYDRGGQQFWFKRETLGSGVYSSVLYGPIWLVPGEKPIGMVESATASDVLHFVVRGTLL